MSQQRWKMECADASISGNFRMLAKSAVGLRDIHVSFVVTSYTVEDQGFVHA
jgi:hypothetical protein